MKVVENEPESPEIRKYVEKYQYFEISGPLLVKAVPTGTLECWTTIDGSFEIFDPETATFFASNRSGVFPIGSQVSAYFVPKSIKCFNMKLRPQILCLPNFKNVITNWRSFSVTDFIGGNAIEQILSLDFLEEENFARRLDQMLLEHNDFEGIDSQLESVLNSMVSESTTNIRVEEVASDNHLTIKSLERLTKKMFGMTPKKLMSILRFGESTKYLNNTEGYKFIDTLQFGYYDQSHFIRECRKITQMNPKEFLSKLKLSTNDLVVED